MKLPKYNFGHLRRIAQQVVVVAVSATVISTMISPSAQAATIGSAPQINLARIGDNEVQVAWEAPSFTVETADGSFHGPSGWRITVHNPGSSSTIYTSNSCTNLAAAANECSFIAPTGKSAFDVRVTALYNYDNVSNSSPAGIGSIDFAASTDFENVLIQASSGTTAEISWTNNSAAAKSGVAMNIYVDGQLNSVVTEFEGAAPESASLVGLLAGFHSVLLMMVDANDSYLAEYEITYVHPVVPQAPIVGATFSTAPNGSNLVTVTWTTNADDASTINGWDVTVTTDGETLPDGCVSITANTRTCVLTEVDPAARYEIAVSATYGQGALGNAGFALIGIEPISNLAVAPSSTSGATLTWEIDDILAARVDHTEVTFDGLSIYCPEADAFNECVLTDLVIDQTYVARVSLIGFDNSLLAADQISFVFNGIPTPPVVSISEPNQFGTATVSWAYPDNIIPTGVNGWDIYVHLAGIENLVGTCDAAQLPVGTTSCTIEDVTDTTGVLVELRPVYGQNLFGGVAYGSLHIDAVTDLVGTIDAANEANISWSIDPLIDAITDSASITVNGEAVACADALVMNECVVAGLTLDTTHTVVLTLLDYEGNIVATESADFTLSNTPDAPAVSVVVDGSVATVSWTYTQEPAGISGFDVIVESAAMDTIAGTCADSTFTAQTRSCTITNIDPSDSYEIAVRPIYGTDLLGAAGYVYINVTMVSDFTTTPTAIDEVAVGWEIDPFIDARTDYVVFKIDGSQIACDDALISSECLISGLVVGQVYDVSLQLIDFDGRTLFTQYGSFEFRGAPIAPTVIVANENEFGVATVTWSYSGNLAADGVNGWDVFVTLEDGTDALGTCAASIFSLGQTSCTISDISIANAASVEVSATYGRSLQGRVGYGYVHVEPVSSISALTSDVGQVTVSWTVDPLVDVRLDSAVVTVDDAVVTCLESASSFECVIPNLDLDSVHTFAVVLLDSNETVIGSDSVTATVISTIAAPELDVQNNDTDAVVSWSYPNGTPAGITGWDVIVTTDGVVDGAGTCIAGQLSQSATSCTLSDLDINSGYQVEVTPIFGIAMLGEIAYGFIRVEPINTVVVSAVDADSASLSWAISSLVESRVATISIALDGQSVLCVDAVIHGECLIDGLFSDQNYSVSITALDSDGLIVDVANQEFVFTAAPAAPNASISQNGTTATISWSYPNGILPMDINGWDVVVTTTDGEPILGTCANASFELDTRECTITGITSELSAVIEVRAIYAVGLFTQPDYVYLNVDPISPIETLTSAADAFIISWVVDSLVESRVDILNVRVNNVIVDCPDALTLGQCELTGLIPAQDYFIEIELLDADGALIDNEIATSRLTAVPSAPSIQIVDNGTDAFVSWTYGGSIPEGVNGWFVSVSTSGQTDPTGTCMVGALDVATTSCLLTDLDVLASYEIVVQPLYGFNLVGTSSFAYIRVQAISDFVIEADTQNSAVVAWAVNGLIEPRVETVRVFLDGTEQICPTAGSLSECSFSGLTIGQSYVAMVLLSDANDQLVAEGEFSFIFGGLPASPDVIVEDDDQDGVATVSWSYPNNVLPTGVTGFDVIAFLEDGADITGSCAVGTFDSTATVCSIAGVTPTNAVAVEVRPIYGRGALGDPGYAYLYVTSVDSAKVLTSSATGQVTVSWNVDSLVESRISEITVFVDGIAAVCTDADATNSCVIDGLTPGYEYVFRIGLRGIDQQIFADAYVTSGPVVTPSAPTVAIVDNGTSADVSWSYAQTPTGITGWYVSAISNNADVPLDACFNNELDAATTSCTINGLDLNTGYEIAVTPIYGQSLAGDVGYEYIRINPLSDVAAIPSADSQSRISWNVDDLVLDRVDHVNLYVNDSLVACETAMLSNSCVIPLLVTGISYNLTVSLRDSNDAVIAQQTIEYTQQLPTAAATNFAVAPVVDGSATLTWTYSSNMTGLITGWDIQVVSNLDTQDWVVNCQPDDGVIPAATRSCVVMGLDSEAAYLFEIRTVLGAGVFGTPVYVSLNSSAAGEFAGLATTQTSANLTWSAGLGWDSLIFGYRLSVNGVLVCTLDTSASLVAPNCDVSDLAPGSTSDISIESLDVNATVISTVETTWLQPELPVATNVTTSVNASVITVNWDYVSSNSTANIVGWQVLVEDRYGALTGSCTTTLDAAARSCTVTADDVTLGNRITINAVYDQDVVSADVVEYRGPVSAVTEAAIYPEAGTVNSAVLNFTGVDLVTEYVVEATDESGATALTVSNLGENTWRIGTVTPGQKYQATIRPVVDGVSAFDAVSTFLYTAVDVPNAPQNVIASMTGVARQVAVNFAASSTNGISVKNYTVTMSTAGREDVSITSNNRVVLFDSLPPGLTYSFSVVANSFVGSSAAGTATITTLNVPNAPTLESIELVSSTSVRVTWTGSEPAAGRADVDGYFITVAPSAGLTLVTTGSSFNTVVVSGLTQGVNYSFGVRASSIAGNSTSSETSSLTTPSLATAVSVRANADSANVNWRAAKGAITDYVVTLTSSHNVVLTQTVAANVLATSFEGLTSGETYAVTIESLVGQISSGSTSAVNVTIDNVPVAPTGVSLALTSASSMRVSWVAPVAASGRAAVTGFKIQAMPADGVSLPITITSIERSAVIADLAPGVAYSVTVSADSNVGSSAASVASDSLYTPSIATDVSAIMTSPTAINATWTAPLGDVTGYTVVALGSNGRTVRTAVDALQDNVSFVGLTQGVTYDITVTANYGRLNAGATSPFSIYITDVPRAPSVTDVELGSATSVTVTWAAPATSDLRAPVTGYVIVATPSAGVSAPVVSADATTGVVSNLAAGVTYSFAVRADSIAGLSAVSNALTIVTPSAPVILTARTTGPEVNLTWRAGRGNVTGYEISLTDESNVTTQYLSIGTGLSKVIGDLATAETYSVSITALYGQVRSPESTVVEFTVANVPNAPTSVVGTLTSATEARITWTSPVTDISRAPTTGYLVTMTPDDGRTFAPIVGSTNRSLIVSDLAPGVVYTFNIRATSLVGSSRLSTDGVLARTPSVPTGVEISPNSATSVSVSWTAPLGGVTGYTVTATPPAGNAIRVSAPSGDTSVIVSSLALNTYYSFTVTALFGKFNAGTSVAVVSHVDGEPFAPTNLNAVLLTTTSAALTWTAPTLSEDRAVPTEYIVSVSPAAGVDIPTIAGDETSAIVTGLTGGTTYNFTIKARSYSGDSVLSERVSLVAPQQASAVTTRATGTDVVVTWRAPRGDVTSYKVAAIENGGSVAEVTVDAPALTTTLTDLIPGGKYTVTVSANFGAVNSGESASASVTIADVPQAPTLPTIALLTETTARVSWTGSLATPGLQVPSGYIVDVTPSEGVVIPSGLSSSARSAVITGLTPGVEYKFAVRATSIVGNSLWSQISSGVTTPEVATDVDVTTGLLPRATVTWTAAAGLVTSYVVTGVPVVGRIVKATVAGDVYSATLSNLLYDTEYSVTVTAFYGRLTVGPSIPVTFTSAIAPTLPNIFTRPTSVVSTGSIVVTYSELVPTAPVTISGYFILVDGLEVAGCGSATQLLPTPTCTFTDGIVGTNYRFQPKAVVQGYRTTDYVLSAPSTAVKQTD